MPNLQNIIEENKKSLNDTSLFRAGGSCWEVCDFEAICEDIKENNHLSQLRLIEGFREMVREKHRKVLGSGSGAGAFALGLDWSGGNTYYYVGFRCVRGI
jgi:hypothetical protein